MQEDKILGFNRKQFVEDIVNNRFNGNITRCANELKISAAYLHGLIYNTKYTAGKKFFNAVIMYCRNNKMDWQKYIFVSWE